MIRQRHYLKRYTPLRRSRKPIRRDARTAEERRRDREWREEVMAKCWHACALGIQHGPCWGPLDCHHVHGRKSKADRYGDGVLLCRKHHDWAHAHPREVREMFA